VSAGNPPFEDSKATKEWRDYFGEVDRLLRPLSTARRAEVRDELVAHVLDGMDVEPGEDEAGRLRKVLDRLGPPAEYLDRVVGDMAIAGDQSSVWKLKRTIATLGRNAALVSTYLLGLIALLLAIAKPIWPDYVGFYRLPGGWLMAGYVDVEGATELAGYWLVPIMLALAYLFWIVVPRWIGRLRD
jgi:hypothetical protein